MKVEGLSGWKSRKKENPGNQAKGGRDRFYSRRVQDRLYVLLRPNSRTDVGGRGGC